MSPPVPRAPAPRRAALVPSLVLGTGFAVTLFVLMALAQMMGRVQPPETEVDESVMAYVAPEIEEVEEEEPPPPEEEEPPPRSSRPSRRSSPSTSSTSR